jgi:hypothetical protein
MKDKTGIGHVGFGACLVGVGLEVILLHLRLLSFSPVAVWFSQSPRALKIRISRANQLRQVTENITQLVRSSGCAARLGAN